MSTRQLNPEQNEAVEYLAGPLLVLAGAGSGKTGVITAKITRLLDRGYRPDQIAAVTFTNKAAREMKQRVASSTKRTDTQGLNVATFHSLGVTIIRAEADTLELKRGFSIFDAEDSDRILADLVGRDVDARKRTRAAISAWKTALVDPEGAVAEPGGDAAAANAYREYQRRLAAYNAVDFDDLLRLPVQLFRDHPDARERWQNGFRYILVDEFQDTNTAQHELLKLLVGPRGALTAVGDDDQSIYGWRGAEPGHIAGLSRDYPNLKVVKLEQNYRSVGRILSAANALIRANTRVYDKNLWSARGAGDPVRVLACSDEAGEAERVVAELSAHRLRHGNRYGDYAVLYRGNYQSRAFEKELRERSIGYRVSGGRSFFEQSEIRDLVAYLRLMVNGDDDAAFLRVVNLPKREIGPATLETLGRYAASRHRSLLACARSIGMTGGMGERSGRRLAEFAEWIADTAARGESGPARQLVGELVSDIDYRNWLRESATNAKSAQRKIANVDDFLTWLGQLDARSEGEACSLEAVVRRLSLLDYANKDDAGADNQVQLLTLHAAKGLEFDHVFLSGLEEGLLPHHSCVEDEEKLAEERRLCYVGITRARKSLSLSYARERRRGGETTSITPSRFLDDLPADELDWPQNRNGKTANADAAQSEQNLAGLRALLGAGENT
ncbi:UvrD-helicase domain-containing protein [Salinisphaera sp. USBA-960]|nr:UvrD-helicase domain-containing protein [Salifodinibacter halophilus]NNC27037.1 UvrD-helicase domain-containing protein [Salifodinibacter halophilus]